MTPTAELRAFLAAVAAAPGDDLPRLAFADWLDEHDQPDRAEFIRVEVGIARTTPGGPGRAALFRRRDELFRRHAAKWFAWFAGLATGWSTERGFVADLTCSPAAFLAHADRWFDTQPVTRLGLDSVWAAGPPRRCLAREVFTSPHLGRLTHLTLERAGVNSAGLYWLARNPAVAGLRELALRDNDITADGVRTLAELPGLAGLVSLDLAGNRISSAGAGHLIRSPHLRNLCELRLSRNPIGPAAWAALEARFGAVLAG